VDLIELDTLDAVTGRSRGKLLLLAQAPPWMSGHYPEVVELAQTGGPALAEYTREWFERLVFVSNANLYQGLPDRQIRLEGLMEANVVLQTPNSNGCCQAAPIVNILDIDKPPSEQDPALYHALITEFYGDPSQHQVKTIGICAVNVQDKAASLHAFVNTPRHKYLKSLDPPSGLAGRHLAFRNSAGKP
jgi:hypothetical protein